MVQLQLWVAMETKVQKPETSPSGLMMCHDKREDMRGFQVLKDGAARRKSGATSPSSAAPSWSALHEQGANC